MANSSEWHVDHANKTRGPFSSSQLKQLAKQSKINRDTKVRLGKDGKWTAAGKVKGLFESTELTPVSKPSPPAVKEAAVPVVAGEVFTKQTSLVVARMPCPMCGEEIAETAVKCRHCNEFLDGRSQPQQQAPQQVYVAPAPQAPEPSVNVSVVQQVGMSHKRWSRLVAVILSFIIPGLGQLYKGQPINGLVWFVLTVAGYMAFIIPGILLHVCCVLGAAMGDPYR